MKLTNFDPYFGDKNKNATIGWLKKAVLDSNIFSIEALNEGISYLSENMYKHEGIIVTDDMEIKRYQAAAIAYAIHQYYEKNTTEPVINEYIINNIYYCSDDDKTINAKVLILAFIMALIGNLTNEVSSDFYKAIKSEIIKESHYEVSSLDHHLIDKTEVDIYNEDNLDVEHITYKINDTQIEVINSLDGWYQVYYISEENSGFGYIRK